jgi:hypothetical protein
MKKDPGYKTKYEKNEADSAKRSDEFKQKYHAANAKIDKLRGEHSHGSASHLDAIEKVRKEHGHAATQRALENHYADAEGNLPRMLGGTTPTIADRQRAHYNMWVAGTGGHGDTGYRRESVELDEVNARHSLEAAQAALTPTARRIKDALSKTNRAKSNTNKYARRISKISPDYTKNDVKDHLKSMGEDLNSRRVYEPTSPQALNPGLQKRIDDASKAQIPPPAGRRPIGKIKLITRKEEVEQVEEGYRGRRAFGTAYDKTRDPFQDSKRAFKSRELEHELAHEAPSGPAHHDQTPHDVHIDGKKWKTFGSAGHAHNVANKLSISGKRATVHKTPIAEKAPPGWEGTVKAMKKHSEIDNPYALAWWMKRKGAKSHKDEK